MFDRVRYLKVSPTVYAVRFDGVDVGEVEKTSETLWRWRADLDREGASGDNGSRHLATIALLDYHLYFKGEDVPMPHVDWSVRWLEEHDDELQPYEGLQIAVQGRNGIVASAPTLGELREKIRAAGIDEDTILFSVVPKFPYAAAPAPIEEAASTSEDERLGGLAESALKALRAMEP